MNRQTRPCRHCGFAYKGRGIYADHGLAEYNLQQHESVCLEQQRRKAATQNRKRLRNARAYRRKLEKLAGKTGWTPPTPGQLGFPFDGVPAIVA